MEKIKPLDQWLSENVFVPKLPQPLGLSLPELENLRTVDSADITFTELEQVNQFIPIKVHFRTMPSLTSGISLWIQLVEDTFYQPHIYLTPEIQNSGLTSKIFKALIFEFGHIYLSSGRTLEPAAIFAISKRLALNRDISLLQHEEDQLLLWNGNPHFSYLASLFRGL